MSSEPALRAIGLRKVYGDFVAVDRVDLQVARGEVLGLLGPNGAGKTTTISMMVGLVPPTEGDVVVEGRSVRKDPVGVRARVGLVPDNPGFYEGMTAWENLAITARLNGVKDESRIDEAISRVGLSGWTDVEVGKFSKGMKQRLGIADALLKSPSVLLLDEPTAGLDPNGSEEVLRLVRSLADEGGIAILMSSHLLHQAEWICDRVAVMDHGRIVAQGTLDQLAGRRYYVEMELEGDVNSAVRALLPLGKVRVEGSRVVVESEGDARRKAVEAALRAGAIPIEVRLRRASLAEAYRNLLGAGS
ncbi:MAG: ABC transporter ATP-binding protein [Conexivisphaera sp.]